MITQRTLILNLPLKGLKAGSEIKVKVDAEGTPLDPFWRRRVKDSKIDKCVEWKPEKAAKKASPLKQGPTKKEDVTDE